MIFTETDIPGVWVIEIRPVPDKRGFFARTFCREEFSARGLCGDVSQCSLSWNEHQATLRGLHYQLAPYGECKLVRCERGAIFDVAVDLRPSSPTYCQWVGLELRETDYRMLYIPEGVAHGFQTLMDRTRVHYQISGPYHAGSAAGVRFNDPAFGVAWPCPPRVISDRDRNYPDFSP